MAIVALVLAALFWFLAGRLADPQIRGLLKIIAIGAVAFAVYLAIFEPVLAWDVKWVGKLFVRMFGAGFRQLLH